MKEETRIKMRARERIDNMTHYNVCYLLRHGSSSDIIFQDKSLWEHFLKKYRKGGGMTPELSKQIGWKN